MELIEKPWGHEEIIEFNEKYVLKRLKMLSGHRCSLQYHNKKKETIYVVSGLLKIYIGVSVDNMTNKLYKPGEYVTINPLILHRMEAIEDTFYLEASTSEMDDVVRCQDDYNRVSE